MTRIIVTKRSYDHHACIEGFPKIWRCGVTVESAVKNLLTSHPDRFSGQVVVIYRLPPGFMETAICQSSRA